MSPKVGRTYEQIIFPHAFAEKRNTEALCVLAGINGNMSVPNSGSAAPISTDFSFRVTSSGSTSCKIELESRVAGLVAVQMQWLAINAPQGTYQTDHVLFGNKDVAREFEKPVRQVLHKYFPLPVVQWGLNPLLPVLPRTVTKSITIPAWASPLPSPKVQPTPCPWI